MRSRDARRRSLACSPRGRAAASRVSSTRKGVPVLPSDRQAHEILVGAVGLKKHFPVKGGVHRRTIAQVRAVDGVDLFVRRGETLALVGESGCGKTTLGRLLLRLIPPTSGEVLFNVPANLYASARDRWHRIAQDDGAMRSPKGRQGAGLDPYAIARALAPEPEFLLLDEPTSALDVSVQAQILNLLKDIQRRQGLTYLLITHNLSVVRHMADRVAVMYLGRIVEEALTRELFESPLHPYTKALLSAVPVPDPKKRRDKILLPGDVPSSVDPPTGCRFHTRCNAVMPHCGWSPRDAASAAAYLFDSSRNPHASTLPALSEVSMEGNRLRLLFGGSRPTEAQRQVVADLVRGRAAEAGGMALQAIREVGLDERP